MKNNSFTLVIFIFLNLFFLFPTKALTVAVIDTGIDINNKYLKNSLWVNPGESGNDIHGRNKSTNGIDDDKNGYVDDYNGFNFNEMNNNLFDDNGHGTHISFIISNYSEKIKIMPLKIYSNFSKGIDPLTASKKAIAYAIERKVDIINYSGGGEYFDQDEFNLLKKAKDNGIILVAAAGNEGKNIDLHPYYPASYKLSNIISVASISSNENLSDWSNYGNVDISALGENIESALPFNKFGKLSGTSQATAIATTRVCQILLDSPKRLKPYEVLDIIQATSIKNEKLNGKVNSQLKISSVKKYKIRRKLLGQLNEQLF